MKLEIEAILKRYYEGETTIEEEKMLREFFQNHEIPADLESHAAQFRYFTQEQKQFPAKDLFENVAADPDDFKNGKVLKMSGWLTRIAAGFALLVIGFTAGKFYNNKNEKTENLAELNSLDPEMPVAEMRKVLAFEQIPQTSASERIQAVNQSYDLAQADQDITRLLTNVLNFDVNVNVRLAALQALLRFESEPGVRQALIQSLSIQTDPNIQILLIEALVAMKEKRAAEPMQQLIRNEDVIEVVRLKAVEGLNSLTKEHKSQS